MNHTDDRSTEILSNIIIEREIKEDYEFDKPDEFYEFQPNSQRAQIFVGLNKEMNCRVLIKRIMLSGDMYDEFENEKFFISNFEHQNIIKFITSFSDDNYGYIIEEYAEGNDLYNFCEQNHWMISVIDWHLRLREGQN